MLGRFIRLGAMSDSAQGLHYELADGTQSLKDAVPLDGHGVEIRDIHGVENRPEFLLGHDVRQVPLVVLDHERNGVDIIPVRFHILIQVMHRLNIRFQTRPLGIGHEDQPVYPFQDEATASVVVGLARDGIKVETSLKPSDLAKIDGEEVEEERPIRLGCQGDHLALGVWVHSGIDIFQVRGLSTQTRPVIDHLAVDLPASVVDHGHDLYLRSARLDFEPPQRMDLSVSSGRVKEPQHKTGPNQGT